MGRAQVPPHANRSLLCARGSYFQEYFLVDCMFKLYRFKYYPYIILLTPHILFHGNFSEGEFSTI